MRGHEGRSTHTLHRWERPRVCGAQVLTQLAMGALAVRLTMGLCMLVVGRGLGRALRLGVLVMRLRVLTVGLMVGEVRRHGQRHGVGQGEWGGMVVVVVDVGPRRLHRVLHVASAVTTVD